MRNILTRAPINKMASLVINQSGVSDKLELNGTLAQRDQLKRTVKMWMRQAAKSNSRRHELKGPIKKANLQLAELNKKLKSYDEHQKRHKPRSFNDALVMVMKNTLSPDIVKLLENEAREIWKS